MQKTLANQPVSTDNGAASQEASGGGASTPSTALTTDAGEGIDMADPHSSKSPAFQFYANEFLMDEHVALMSMQERGVYITLICKCWNEGTLPEDTERLSKLCGMPHSAFRKLWPSILPCFRSSGAERLIHPRLEKERKKQREYRRRQADAAAKRWESRGNATAFPRQVARHPSGNALISSQSQSLSQTQSRTARTSAEDEIGERAGRFVNETYPTLYAKHRKGARYISRPALDFQEALQLCRVWPDDRLEKLAIVFLTTDHEFAEKGSRTIAQFRSMASWCDGKLAEAGIA